MPVPTSSFGREISHRSYEFAGLSCTTRAPFDISRDSRISAGSHQKEATNA